MKKKIKFDIDYLVNFKYKVGDFVREVVSKKLFDKGYLANFSKEIFIIYRLCPTQPPTYQISAIDGKKQKRKYYKEELQSVSKNEFPFDV